MNICHLKCKYPDCTERGVIRVYDRKEMSGGRIHWFCVKHAWEMAERYDDPEYVVICPHCETMFGVN